MKSNVAGSRVAGARTTPSARTVQRPQTFVSASKSQIGRFKGMDAGQDTSDDQVGQRAAALLLLLLVQATVATLRSLQFTISHHTRTHSPSQRCQPALC